MLPKGIRQNNPGNIERNSINWKGLSVEQPDGRFCSFVTPEYGIRAMVRILMTYHSRGTDTVEEIISTWAPKHENPLKNYINFVCSHMFIKPDEPIDINDPNDVIPLLEAIVKFENGIQPYEPEVFETAYYMALGKDKP